MSTENTNAGSFCPTTHFEVSGYEFVPRSNKVKVFEPIQEATVPSDPENDCTFCDPGKGEPFIFDLGQPLDDGHTILKPALGMMIPGYFLTVTKEHITSFAQFDPQDLAAINLALTEAEAYLGTLFGAYFRFEHGSDNVRQCSAGAGACIDHAHQHLIPAGDVADYILSSDHPDKAKLAWQKLDSFENLADFRGAPYMYLGQAGTHYAVADPGVPSQWVRRQLAQVRQLPDWDWAIYNGGKELFVTFARLGEIPWGRIVLSGDKITFESKPRALRGKEILPDSDLHL